MGNICRSPTAEGVFRDLVVKQGLAADIFIDSAGTHAYHEGEEADPRSQKAALARGVDLSGLRARRLIEEDFERFDYVLVMDEKNHASALKRCSDNHQKKLRYFLEFAPHLNSINLPDPYYGGKFGFERVLDMVEDASVGLLKALRIEL
jgi:protein-tyrosine phosphatase